MAQYSFINKLAMKLADDGQRLIESAYIQADYDKTKTQNLHDSYGSAVFYKRELYPGTKRFFTKMATTAKYDPYQHEYITGRRSVEEFLGTFRPQSNGMQLVVVVTMFYGGILEAGQDPLRHKYKVIFTVGDYLKELARKISDNVKILKIQRDEVSPL